MKPPQRLPNEGPRPYSAFTAYCRMGPQRSLAKLGQKHGKSRATLESWSSRFAWAARTAQFDEAVERTRAAAEEKALKAQAAVWAERQVNHRERIWTRAEKILGKIEEAMSLPLVKKTVNKDGKTITINPAKWTFGDMVRGLQTIDNIQRLCLNLPTEKSEVTGPDNTPIASAVIILPGNGREKPESE